MLLKHLYDYALSRKLLDNPAFTPKAVRWVIDLDSDGNLLGKGPTSTGDEKRGNEYSCPWTLLMDNSGKISDFLVGGIDSVFGLSPNPGKPKAPAKLQAKYDYFWQQIVDCDATLGSLSALLNFKKHLNEAPFFLQPVDNEWKMITATHAEIKLKSGDNFSFRVAGKLLLEDEAICNWWRERFQMELNAIKKRSKLGLCIVTGGNGQFQPIADTHRVKIMSVPGGQSSGASLVSFDKAAFASYGLDGGQNCPTSVDASLAYCLALNDLIQSDDTSLPIGGTVLCFWAKGTKAASGLFASLLNKPDPQTVSKFMKSPWAGIERELAKEDQFVAVTLKGCAGRIAVSHWVQEPLDHAVENLKEWFNDFKLDAPPRLIPKVAKKTPDKTTEFNPLSIYWLANTTVREAKELRPETLSQLYRAALENAAPSTALIKPILAQLRSKLADKDYKLIYDDSRFALLKLILNRNRKDSDMEIKPKLIVDTDDPAYNCGRLLSVLSEAQRKAQGYPKGFSGVAERYFGTASASPATVLPLLLRLNRHHLDKIRKSGGSAYEETSIRGIVAKFKPAGDAQPPVFPRHLDLQAQGRFAIGFYQQQAADATGRIITNVLKFLEETDQAAHAELLALQEGDASTFSEKCASYYGSSAYSTWADKKKKKQNKEDSGDQSLLDL